MSLAGFLTRRSGVVSRTVAFDVRQLEMIRSIRTSAARLVQVSERQLSERYADLRDGVSTGTARAEGQRRVAVFALVSEALRRTLGIQLYDVQLLAGEALSTGCVAEMQTGEGKTYAITLPACWFALAGEGVHVVTANAYLAQRDLELLRPVYECLGLTAALLPERSGPEVKRQAYNCDITYGTGYEFGFDYLRDQIAADESRRRPLGSDYLRRLRAGQDGADRMQRGQVHAIVDEVDNVLIDDACSPLVIAGADESEAPDGAAHRLAWRLSAELAAVEDFQLERNCGRVSLTSRGAERIHGSQVEIPMAVLQRPWAEYVNQALRARYLLRRDVHYVVNEDDVQIVDGSTGRIFEDRTWQDGLHQAIEAKEGVTIKAERQPLAGISRQRYFRLYRRLCGLTGTARGGEAEFREVYGLSIEIIPPNRPSQLVVHSARYFAKGEGVWTSVAVRARELVDVGRPVLIGTQSIEASEAVSERLNAAVIDHCVLNGRQDAAEADIVARAGEPGRVTVATNLAGRGTDIRLSTAAAAVGGLHVIACGRHRAGRIDRQLIGRSARQGAPGSAEVLVSADDPLIADNAAWLGARMVARASADGETREDCTAALDRVQRRVVRVDSGARLRMLQRDVARDQVLGALETFGQSRPGRA
ncbi:MAG: hypothetical protein KDA75_13275 [Planctomycetaceae bacterium]|nr:hypothetical protein [Planctomycetaceae bacterium]